MEKSLITLLSVNIVNWFIDEITNEIKKNNFAILNFRSICILETVLRNQDIINLQESKVENSLSWVIGVVNR